MIPVMASCYPVDDGGVRPVHMQDQCLLKDKGWQAAPVLSTNGGRKLGITASYLPGTIRVLVNLPGASAGVALRAYGEYLSNHPDREQNDERGPYEQ